MGKSGTSAVGRRLLLALLVSAAIGLVAPERLGSAPNVPKPQSVLDPENDNEARLNRLQPPDRVLNAAGVAPGMIVAEIGAGHGRYTVQLAARVGAEDMEAKMEQAGFTLDRVETLLLENGLYIYLFHRAD